MVGQRMTSRAVQRRWQLIPGLVLLLGLGGRAHAADVQACRELRQRREALASRAMEQELALVRTIRGRLCPRLALQAEGANARDGRFTTINYAAWNRCRLEAERKLEATHPIRYRNRQRFTFFTVAGADLAAQADQLMAQWQAQGCE
ncbi:MAG: hypothetical protein RLZZ609_1875 [Cyanobacteriota bacterium]|jgi:hypothetical protein